MTLYPVSTVYVHALVLRDVDFILYVHCAIYHKKPGGYKFSKWVPKTFDLGFFSYGPKPTHEYQTEKTSSIAFWDIKKSAPKTT